MLTKREPGEVLSSFDGSIEGWRLAIIAEGGPYARTQREVKPQHIETGGNPGGYIALEDPSHDTSYWKAPPKFLGIRDGFYGGQLQFDLSLTTEPDPDLNEPDVILAGAGRVLVLALGRPPGREWTSYSVALHEAAGWKQDALAGAVVTQAEMQAVLSSLEHLFIRGEYTRGVAGEVMALDNVRLSKGR